MNCSRFTNAWLSNPHRGQFLSMPLVPKSLEQIVVLKFTLIHWSPEFAITTIPKQNVCDIHEIAQVKGMLV
jgi:hypothetical protein